MLESVCIIQLVLVVLRLDYQLNTGIVSSTATAHSCQLGFTSLISVSHCALSILGTWTCFWRSISSLLAIWQVDPSYFKFYCASTLEDEVWKSRSINWNWNGLQWYEHWLPCKRQLYDLWLAGSKTGSCCPGVTVLYMCKTAFWHFARITEVFLCRKWWFYLCVVKMVRKTF